MSGMHDAMLWEELGDKKVHCLLCGHSCKIKPDQCGVCQVRKNVQGQLKTLNYHSIIALNVDPIEKKPLFHYLPGSTSLSIAAPGCNFQCEFCQNWQISQMPRINGRLAGEDIPPSKLVQTAERYECQSISYTYTEPTIFFELAYDTAILAKARGLGNTFVSNGYMTPQAVKTIAPYLDAINVDLKAFRDETYRRIMKARLSPVLTCLEALVEAGVWVEVTTLVVPGMNDSSEELREIARFIVTHLGTHVPWHVSRFHGDYKMTSTPSTPLETLVKACEIAGEEGLRFVYSGNVPGQASESTYCPGCQEILIDRTGFQVRKDRLVDGACPSCGEKIEGVWSAQ